MKRIKEIGLIVLTVLVFVTLSYSKPIVYGGLRIGFSRYWDAYSLQKSIGANCGIGFSISKGIGLTFDYDFDYFFPIKAKGNIREYHIIYHDLYIACNLFKSKGANIQIGIGASHMKSHIKFLEDSYFYRSPNDIPFYHKGEVGIFTGTTGLSGKISFWIDIPTFNDRLSFCGTLKAKTTSTLSLLPAKEPCFPNAETPHLPFHLSLGLVYRL